MIDIEYSQSNKHVNTESNFTFHNQSNILSTMTFGERLVAAMAYKKIDQTELAKITGISQPTISKIVLGYTESSTFTVQLAVTCGVRPEWLAMESGEMVDGLYVHDEKLKQLLMIAQDLPEYGKDKAIREVTEIAEFIEHAARAAKQ